jgi:hypothetical protein
MEHIEFRYLRSGASLYVAVCLRFHNVAGPHPDIDRTLPMFSP